MDICAINFAGLSICKVVGWGLFIYFIGPVLIVIGVVLFAIIMALIMTWLDYQRF